MGINYHSVSEESRFRRGLEGIFFRKARHLLEKKCKLFWHNKDFERYDENGITLGDNVYKFSLILENLAWN